MKCAQCDTTIKTRTSFPTSLDPDSPRVCSQACQHRYIAMYIPRELARKESPTIYKLNQKILGRLPRTEPETQPDNITQEDTNGLNEPRDLANELS